MPRPRRDELASGGAPFALLVIVLAFLLLAGCGQPTPSTPAAEPGLDQMPTAEGGKKGLSAEENVLLQAAIKSELQLTDCIKCHSSEPADIQRNGGKHKTKLSCRDCHLEHRPLGTKTIPKCSMCHDPNSREHFKLTNCLGCHRNPHTPLEVTVDDVPQVSTACKTCHPAKGEEFQKFPSKHAAKNCTFCHPKKHKQIKRCLECHTPHADYLGYKECLQCHKPHSPLNIRYAEDIPNKYCGSCHTEIFAMLSQSKAKHGSFQCAFCHKDKHPTVPNCRDCHEQPHDDSMLSPFNSDCLKCHKNPHDLVF